MSYRIIRVTNLYSEYLTQYQLTFPKIKETTYREQYNHLIADSVDAASSFTKNLKDIGIDAFDIFTNAEDLQNQWRTENNCTESGKELIVKQLKILTPDVLWLDDNSLIEKKWISHVRENVPSIKIITGQICAPYKTEQIKDLQSLDFLFTCTPCLKKEFEENGIMVHLIYHAFEKGIIERIGSENHFPQNDLIFTGSLFPGGGFHSTRIKYIEQMLKANLPIKIYGNLDTLSNIILKKGLFYTIALIRKMHGDQIIRNTPFLKNYESYDETPIKFYSKKLRQSVSNPIFGLDQFKLLAKSKVCFNIHGEIAKGCAGNQRLFEATGVGTCLITDWKENLQDLFELEKEVVTYKSEKECIYKMKWLMENPMEAVRIAKAGQSRTLRDHTIQNRVKLINEILKNSI